MLEYLVANEHVVRTLKKQLHAVSHVSMSSECTLTQFSSMFVSWEISLLRLSSSKIEILLTFIFASLVQIILSKG